MQGLVSWLVLVAAFAVVAAAGGIVATRLCRFGVRSLRPAGHAAVGAMPRRPSPPASSPSESSPSESSRSESSRSGASEPEQPLP